MALNWADLARRAAKSVERGTGTDTTFGTIAFVAIDGSAGAVHVLVEGGLTMENAQRFAQRFTEVCFAEGRPMRVVSVTRSSGVPLGVTPFPVNPGVSCCTEASEGDGSLVRRLHIARSIAAAQALAESSVLGIGNEVRGIFDLAREQTTALQGLVNQYAKNSGGNETITSTIDELGEAVDTLTGTLVARVNEQATSLGQAHDWSNEIVRLGEAIGAIASTARMLTFNARIKAARVGAAGKGFVVIAQSIQELAAQVKETNDSVGMLAGNLARALPTLHANARAMSVDTTELLGVLAESLDRVRHQLEVTRREAHGSLVSSSNTATELKSRANQLIEKLQYQDRAHQMLDEARIQADALLRLLGVDERKVDQAVIDQVGWLGKQHESKTPVLEAGSIELF